MEIPFVDMAGDTPAKELTRRAGSSIPPAYRLASSTLSILAPVVAILFNGCSLFRLGRTVTSSSSRIVSFNGMFRNTSLEEVTSISLKIADSYPTNDACIS